MRFDSESAFRYWLKINGYTDDTINELSPRWNLVSIENGQITDSVTQVEEQVTDSVITTD